MSKDDAEALVGDGRAEVVVSHEQADKDFGNGSSSFCSIKLTVNQDEQSITAGAELASALALELLPRIRDAARAVWDPPPKKEPAPRGRDADREPEGRGRGRGRR